MELTGFDIKLDLKEQEVSKNSQDSNGPCTKSGNTGGKTGLGGRIILVSILDESSLR